MKATINGVEIVLTAEQIQQIADAKKPKKTAKEWLEEFLKQDFTVKHELGFISYYLGDQCLFQQNLISELLWCHYYKVWRVLEDEFGMNYEQIQHLCTETIATTFNCKGFTPVNLTGGVWLLGINY